MGKMTLTGKGRRWVTGGHPWIYKDDIAEGKGEAGELLPVYDPAGQSVGWGVVQHHLQDRGAHGDPVGRSSPIEIFGSKAWSAPSRTGRPTG